MKAIFVAGTGTGIGKTMVTGCLFGYLTAQGYNVITQKWVQTGSKSIYASDIGEHFKIAKQDLGRRRGIFPLMLPYIFKAGASPHLAAESENRKISINIIKKSFKALVSQFDFVIVEGSGGALVPFNRKKLVIDIVKELKIPVLLVAGNELGAINHTLLTLESLGARKIKVLGAVFNNFKRQNNIILKDNPQIVKQLTGKIIFGVLPYKPARKKVYAKFMPIGKQILKQLKLHG